MVSVLAEPSSEAQGTLPQYNCYVSKKKIGNDLFELVEQALNGTLTQVVCDKS